MGLISPFQELPQLSIILPVSRTSSAPSEDQPHLPRGQNTLVEYSSLEATNRYESGQKTVKDVFSMENFTIRNIVS